jgi:hypothetical protein
VSLATQRLYGQVLSQTAFAIELISNFATTYLFLCTLQLLSSGITEDAKAVQKPYYNLCCDNCVICFISYSFIRHRDIQ